ncbi:MAG: hypothetical protein M3068_06965 [Gemmatimonadota bacterium]|nr:hypothetical protein [Gemmatimonadota bacterium]
MPLPPLRNVLAILLLACLSACERLDVGPAIEGKLARGRQYADSVTRRVNADLAASSSDLLAVGYLERQRLGLGSPFRLVDYIEHDDRLSPSVRQRAAWAVLARTLDGAGYELGASALDDAALSNPRDGSGSRQLALIDATVRRARDPRAGELAIRIAYTLGSAELAVRASATQNAAGAAALVRDRELARHDATTLLVAARREGVDPLMLLPVWRAEHRFDVERPLLEPLAVDVEQEALDLASAVLAELRALVGSPQASAHPAPLSRSLIEPPAAERLAELIGLRRSPPQAPIVITLAQMRRRLMYSAPDRAARMGRWRFLSRASNEESFAAEYAMLSGSRRAIADGALSQIAIAAAVALRPYAQESPWLPGSDGPTDKQLESTLGPGAVSFDAAVPIVWRPYYRRMLMTALADLERVVPALDVHGLRVHFGDSGLGRAALALHDPRRRTIWLPLATSAGTLAHEIAHDLDWQEARRRYAVYGDYATDRAVRERRGALAQSVEGLSAAMLEIPSLEHSSPLAQRPTELFARNVDWFVASALAHDGRMDGYLSSVQDEYITGYGAVRPPDQTGGAARALVRLLNEVAPPAESARETYLARFGPARVPSSEDLLRALLETPPPRPDSAAIAAPLAEPVGLSATRVAALARLDAAACRDGASHAEQRLFESRRRLVVLVEAASLRGAIRARLAHALSAGVAPAGGAVFANGISSAMSAAADAGRALDALDARADSLAGGARPHGCGATDPS